MRKLTYIFIVLFVLSGFAFAEDTNVTDIVKELQLMKQDGNDIKMVWWIPVEYWEVAYQQNPIFTQDVLKEIIKILDDYHIFAVIDAKFDILGELNSKTRSHLIENTSLHINNQKIDIISDESLPQNILNFGGTMKQLFAGAMGKVGEGLELLYFPSRDENGIRKGSPKSEGKLIINYNGNEFKWRLPLGSFMPSKFDLETGDKFPGNYIYNPFTGDSLSIVNPNESKQ